MRIFRNIDNYDNESGQKLWVTLGTFDGMHLGHRFLLEQLKEYASKIDENPRTLVITFEIHPHLILADTEQKPRPITTARHKLKMIEQSGIDDCLLIDFTEKIANITAEQFIEDWLIKKLKISGIVLGYNNRFGCEAKGDFKLLKKYAQKYGFHAILAKPKLIDGLPVSSTRIREVLKNGNLKTAEKMLGRRFSVLGIITAGERIGRKLGFPTANVEFGIEFLPPLGVYGVEVKGIAEDTSKKYFGVANIGFRPTFHINRDRPQLEVFILDFDRNIYGKEVEIIFLTKIRDEIKFDSIEELRANIEKDIATFRNYLANNS